MIHSSIYSPTSTIQRDSRLRETGVSNYDGKTRRKTESQGGAAATGVCGRRGCECLCVLPRASGSPGSVPRDSIDVRAHIHPPLTLLYCSFLWRPNKRLSPPTFFTSSLDPRPPSSAPLSQERPVKLPCFLPDHKLNQNGHKSHSETVCCSFLTWIGRAERFLEPHCTTQNTTRHVINDDDLDYITPYDRRIAGYNMQPAGLQRSEVK